jgi:hypothetical protein
MRRWGKLMGLCSGRLRGMSPLVKKKMMGSEDPLVQEVIGDRVSSSQPNQSHFYFQTATGAGFSESCTNDSNSERDLTLQLLEERAKVESAQI